VSFPCDVDESVYDPIGVVHGGPVSTVLDTVAGCAVHTTPPAGR
jgi:acyl-coenzyme A thioesterase PaaI-like protein